MEFNFTHMSFIHKKLQNDHHFSQKNRGADRPFYAFHECTSTVQLEHVYSREQTNWGFPLRSQHTALINNAKDFYKVYQKT
jgi:hypothetical protein